MHMTVKGITATILSVLAIFAGIAVAVYGLKPASSVKTDAEGKVLRSKRIANKANAGRVETRIRARDRGEARNPLADKMSDAAKNLDQMLAADLGGLSAEYQTLIRDLRLALEDDDKKRMLKAIQGLLGAYQSGVKLPMVVLESMAHAVASCGSEALSEMVGLLASKDPAVAEVAADSFEEMLMMADGDGELSEMIISVVPYLKDTELINSALMELDHMRNSVRVKTAVAIFESGQEVAVNVLKDNVSTYFSEEGAPEVKTCEDVINFGKNNPDGEDDETFYGKWMNQAEDD